MPWGLAAAAVVGAVSQNVQSNRASGDINRSQAAAQSSVQDAAMRARIDVNRLFPEARQSADLGFQGALDVFGQSVPSQANVFQQGNVGAQQQILAGLPQMQNAILGGNVDLSGLQPVSLQPDLSFMSQQLPFQPALGSANPLGGFRNGMPTDFSANPLSQRMGGSSGAGSSAGPFNPFANFVQELP